jgi:hypothetical protein
MRTDALRRLQGPSAAIDALDRSAKPLGLPPAIETDLRNLLTAQARIRR